MYMTCTACATYICNVRVFGVREGASHLAWVQPLYDAHTYKSTLKQRNGICVCRACTHFVRTWSEKRKNNNNYKDSKKKMSFREHEVTIKCITVIHYIGTRVYRYRHSCANLTECVSLLSMLDYLRTTVINDELAFYALYACIYRTPRWTAS